MYLKRYVESEIERRMKSAGVIVVSGPKFCGKTTTATLFAKSVIKLNTTQAIDLARMEPHNTLIGEQPRLVDEWQTVPDIWNEAKAWIDENPKFGQFILTGSSTPADKTKIHHSGAGRIVSIMMRPMSLFESLDSKGTVSLGGLFDNPGMPIYDLNEDHQIADTAFLLCPVDGHCPFRMTDGLRWMSHGTIMRVCSILKTAKTTNSGTRILKF